MSPRRVRRRTAVAWLALAVLAAAIAASEYVERAATAARPRDPGLLLAAPLDEVGAIEIADAGRLHRFERDAAGAWFYHGVHAGETAAHTHAPDPALAERIAGTFAALARARVERQFPVERGADRYGVAAPDRIVLAYRRGESEPMAQYAIGHVAPDTVSQYVMVVGRPVVATIPKYQIDNLMALVQAAGAAERAQAPAGADGTGRR